MHGAAHYGLKCLYIHIYLYSILSSYFIYTDINILMSTYITKKKMSLPFLKSNSHVISAIIIYSSY